VVIFDLVLGEVIAAFRQISFCLAGPEKSFHGFFRVSQSAQMSFNI
jgi:hypothetical protein